MRTRQFLWPLESLPFYQGQICHVEHIPPREAGYGFLDRPLPDPLRRALEVSGISDLYVHLYETQSGQKVETPASEPARSAST